MWTHNRLIGLTFKLSTYRCFGLELFLNCLLIIMVVNLKPLKIKPLIIMNRKHFQVLKQRTLYRLTHLLPTLWVLSIIFCAWCSESNISKEMHVGNGTLVTHELSKTHFTTQNNLAPVMLCQYLLTEDKCCYCFVISTLAGDLGSAVPVSAAKECQLIWGHSEKSTIFLTTDKQRWLIWTPKTLPTEPLKSYDGSEH